MIRSPHPDHIAGGRVTRTFRMNGKQLFAGHMLTREELLRMPAQNRNAMVENGYMTVWPKEAVASEPAASERHVSHSGFGKYDVIEGRKLNDAPLTREEAHALAGLPPPAGNGAN
jgi:hypothetical protein